MDILQQIFEVVNKRQPLYQERYTHRRVTKLSEETGEVSEAFLSVTSESNGKNKTFEDVREEAVDSAIVALDIALTKFPGEEDWDDEQLYTAVEDMIAKKLKKWKKKLKDKTDIM
ncbi:MAG: MazG-like family protein [Gammaproteobacteria bacterium]|nr:MazG-like family protein [Gammaproteobacteria bacterium]